MYPGHWLGNPGHLAKEERPIGHESYGGREESVAFDEEKSTNANDRGSYGQRARSIVYADGRNNESTAGGDNLGTPVHRRKPSIKKKQPQ